MPITAKRITFNRVLSGSVWVPTKGYVLGPIWAVHRTEWSKKWTLTHRRTGRSVSQSLATFGVAKRASFALTSACGAKAWRFDDPMHVRMPLFKECRAIVAKFEAMRR